MIRSLEHSQARLSKTQFLSPQNKTAYRLLKMSIKRYQEFRSINYQGARYFQDSSHIQVDKVRRRSVQLHKSSL